MTTEEKRTRDIASGATAPDAAPAAADGSVVAGFCQSIAWLSIIAGAAMIFFGFADLGKAGAPSIGLGFALCFSATGWFAAARIIILLAQIARNTERR